MAEDKKLVGRPSKYNAETADNICSRICDGESVRQICASDEMPHMATVFRWLSEDLSFREQYTRAKEAQAELYAEEIVDISDDGTNDYMEKFGADGQSVGWVLNGEHVQRSRLRVDSRKWVAAKLLPKKYGDKQQVEHSGSIDVGLADKLEQARKRGAE